MGRDCVIGVDGGGTKTVAWVAPLDAVAGEVGAAGCGVSGPANPSAVGVETTLRHISEAVQLALSEAGVSSKDAVALCLGLAGVSGASRQSLIARLQLHAPQVLITNDAEPLLACGTPDGWGVALIAGTGSFALARGVEGRTVSAGGWGYRFGDEGSAYALAMSGLNAVAREFDGMGTKTQLTSDLLAALNIGRPTELVAAVYDESMDRQRLAGLATVVTATAAAGDQIAIELVRAAADSLAELVVSVQRKLACPSTALPVAATGGVLLKSQFCRECLEESLRGRGLQVELCYVHDPVAGAVLLARQEAQRN